MTNKKGIRIIATLMAVAMVVGILTVLPFAASAYHNNDKVNSTAPVGVQTPDDITVYDGVQTTTPENGAVALKRDSDGVFLIQSAAEFMYFRNVLAVQETLLVGAVDAAAEDLTALPTAEATFKLTCDIALNNETYGTVGEQNDLGVAPAGTFTGIFDGGNHTIYNMYHYNNNANTTLALFHTVTGIVKNLKFAGARLLNSAVGPYNGTYSALVARDLSGTIDNVHGLSCTVGGTFAAGIVTRMKNGSVVQNCSMDGSVSGANIGGIVATHDDASVTTENAFITIADCINYAKVTAPDGDKAYTDHSNYISGAAGILGGEVRNNAKTTGFRITRCVNKGDIFAPKYAGGIIAVSLRPQQEATITDCTNYGAVTTSVSGGSSGGIGGALPHYASGTEHITTVLTRCYNYGAVTAPSVAGGIVGCAHANVKLVKNADVYFHDCGNYGPVSSDGIAGGILGRNADVYSGVSYLFFYNCTSAGAVHGLTNAGGLIGQAVPYGNTIKIYGYLSTCDVSGNGDVGAIVGSVVKQWQNGKLELKNAWVTGTISTAEDGRVAVFCNTGEITTTTVTVDEEQKTQYSTTNQYPTKITAVDCGFHVTVKVANAVLSTEQIAGVNYYLPSGNAVDATDRDAFMADVQQVMNSYYDGSKTVNEACPVADASAFTTSKTALDSLNTYALNNSYTPWVQGTTAPVVLRALGISGATMSLGGSMALNMKLDASVLSDFDSANVDIMNMDTGVAIPAVNTDGYFTSSFVTRAADMAGDLRLCVITTIGGVEYKSTNILTYSPLTYLTNLYADYTGDKAEEANARQIVNVVTKMLNYGAVAEAKDKGISVTETDVALATGATAALDFSATGYAPDKTDKAAINAIAATGATLTGGIEMTFTLNAEAPAYTTLTVEGLGTFDIDGNKFTVTGIHAGAITNVLKLTFSGEGLTDVTASFTVGDFLEARRMNENATTEEIALAEATIMYMMAVRAYAMTLN